MELAEISGHDSKKPRDRSDAPILASLIAAKADFLVTGDGDLTALRDDHPIVSPHDFADKL